MTPPPSWIHASLLAPLHIPEGTGKSAADADADVDAGRLALVRADTPAQRLLTYASFLALGLGVSLPWTLLRSGIAYFCAALPSGPSSFLYLFAVYYAPGLPALALQASLDRGYDAAYGARLAFTFRLVVSLFILAVCLGALSALSSSEAAVLTLGVAIGVFDAIAYGSASQLFSVFPARAGASYLAGSSVSSLLVISLGYATGANGEAPTQAQMQVLFLCGAGVVVASIVATAALLRSSAGVARLAVISTAAEAATPRTAAASPASSMSSVAASAALALALPSRTARAGGVEQGDPGRAHAPLSLHTPGGPPRWSGRESALGGTLLRQPLLTGGDEDGAAADDRAGACVNLLDSQHGAHSPAGAGTGAEAEGGGKAEGEDAVVPTNWELLSVTQLCHVSMVLIWFGTVVVDSLITFVPSQGDRVSAYGDHTAGAGGMVMNKSFRVMTFYASLVGELTAKQVNLVWGSRPAQRTARRRTRTRGEDEGSIDDEHDDCEGGDEGEGGGGAGHRRPLAPPRTPLVSRPTTLLVLVVARTLLMVPFALYLTQRFWGAATSSTSSSGSVAAACSCLSWGDTDPPSSPHAQAPAGVYCDSAYVVFQFLFDFGGAFLSCMTYAIGPTLLPSAGLAPQSQSLLALSMTLGTYAGLAVALGLMKGVLQTA